MTSISSFSAPNSWIIETQNTSYIVAIASNDFIQQRYWGPKLPRIQDYLLLDLVSNESFSTHRSDDFPAWGGYQFHEPCLKVRFHDGVRACVLRYQTASVEQDTLTITLADDTYALVAEVVYRAYPAVDIVERFVTLRNASPHPIVLEQALSAAWHFPIRDQFTLRTLAGMWAGEFQVQDVPVRLGKTVIERRSGSTGFANTPWFALTSHPTATETHGEVWFGALQFSGNYKLVLEQTADGRTYLAGGINNFDFEWRLEEYETLRLPSFVGGFTTGGYGAASRALHRYTVEHLLPRATAHTPRPIVYNSWYVTTFDVNVENQAAAAEIAAQLGVEYFVIDDGWFGARNSDQAGLGDWVVNAQKFPQGLRPLIERVQAMGMQFGIWVEPEMVNPDSDLYRAHPDWVYHFPQRPRTLRRNQLVLNMARPDVQAYLFDALHRLLSENDIRFVKWDMNRHFSEPGWPDAPAGRDREIWVRHTWAVYDLLQRLRTAHPHVIFESCSGGGGRVDLGVMPYVEQFWMSDNTDAYDDLLIQEGFSMAYPLRTRMAWVTDNLGFNGRRPLPLTYRFHVAMMGALGVGADLSKWPDADRALAREMIALYKEIRPVVQLGELYRLRSPRHNALAAQQFVYQDEAVVFTFLSQSQYGTQHIMLPLQGLEPDALYRVWEPRTAEPERVVSGAALMAQGLHIAMIGDYQSRLIRVRQQGRVEAN